MREARLGQLSRSRNVQTAASCIALTIGRAWDPGLLHKVFAMSGPKPLLRCFRTHGEAADLLARAETLAQYDQNLRAYLPDPLDQHCMLANVRGSIAILAADSAGWASRLRYLAPALLPRLIGMGLAISRIDVVVMPPAMTAPPAPRPMIPAPSPAAASTLIALADRTGDMQLAAALRRLASRAKMHPVSGST